MIQFRVVIRNFNSMATCTTIFPAEKIPKVLSNLNQLTKSWFAPVINMLSLALSKCKSQNKLIEMEITLL